MARRRPGERLSVKWSVVSAELLVRLWRGQQTSLWKWQRQKEISWAPEGEGGKCRQ